MKFSCVLFDLDGTLLDTLQDIAYNMNRALVIKGLAPLALEAYTDMVGWGMYTLAYKALPPALRTEQNAYDLASCAIQSYAENPALYTKPYPGIPAVVAALKERGALTAVLTNKPDRLAQAVIERLFAPASFDYIAGVVAHRPAKPDPQAVWAVLARLGVAADRSVIIGDSEIDLESARAAGTASIAVSWGFRTRQFLESAGADLLVDTPEALLAALT
ncbi:MAG: HAD-IA family hydrolase [Spirochaetaceae bacterium]|jgi:phosphoglycolate phosphatase|nr:HAD-IA family hydrolase [Spirochaetaceae bacterium]